MTEQHTWIKAFSAINMERQLAFLIDILICILLAMFPRIGWIVGLVYFLTRDGLNFLNGQSIGKRFFKLQTVKINNQAPLSSHIEKSVIRNLVFLIPGVNIIDIYLFYSKGYRLADKWAETMVIKTEDQTDS
ncbi:hypothetical protein DMA11_11285 [Marinilabiliaceae bacterium JC017]|nr:hypothetical protein DMA11_11285 [Marinilabiliaceae bacterium JC017]